MYSREYRGRTVSFEASGGLKNASLVMQDQETDTYWSIMEGEAVYGQLEGERLVELPVGEKMQWRHWKRRHPDTLVLSVDGREDGPDSYRGYFLDDEGFQGVAAVDDRLATKAPIFAFHDAGQAYAVPHDDIEGGSAFALDSGVHVFVFRRQGSSMFESSVGFVSSSGFEEREGEWVDRSTGARFDRGSREFGSLDRLTGFDTFWYNFSLNNPEAKLLE